MSHESISTRGGKTLYTITLYFNTNHASNFTTKGDNNTDRLKKDGSNKKDGIQVRYPFCDYKTTKDLEETKGFS